MSSCEGNFLFCALKDSVLGTTEFILGFLIGTLIDVFFFKLYKKIDPEENNLGLLTVVMFFQIFTLILIFNSISRYVQSEEVVNMFIRIGMISSQIYLVQYAGEKFGLIVYDRKEHKTTISTSLSKIPLIGKYFD